MSDVRPEEEIQWPPANGVLVRFLHAFAEKLPAGTRTRLVELAEDERIADAADPGEREQALALVRHAVTTWLPALFQAAGDESSMKGLRSLPVTQAEDLEAVGVNVRESYVQDLPVGPLRSAAESVAGACEAAADLRVFENPPPRPVMGSRPGGTPVAHTHHPSPETLDRIAKSLAAALPNAAEAGVIGDPGSAAQEAVEAAVGPRSSAGPSSANS